MNQMKFFKGCLHKFHLVHSWIPCLISYYCSLYLMPPENKNRFSDTFREYRKEPLVWNMLTLFIFRLFLALHYRIRPIQNFKPQVTMLNSNLKQWVSGLFRQLSEEKRSCWVEKLACHVTDLFGNFVNVQLKQKSKPRFSFLVLRNILIIYNRKFKLKYH